MPTLYECLTDTPRRTLLVIARQRGLAPRTDAPKGQLVETLARALAQTENLQRAPYRFNK